MLIVDQSSPFTFYVRVFSSPPTANPSSLRRVIEGLRNRPEESYLTTRAALTSGVTDDQLVIFPYVFVMAMTAAGMAAVALLYAIMLLFRQRQAEFRALRSFGATRMLLAVDLALLFASPADTCLRAGRRLRHHPGRELQRGVRRPRLAGKPAGNSRPGLRPGDRRSRNRPRCGQSHPNTAARVGPRRHDVLNSSRFRSPLIPGPHHGPGICPVRSPCDLHECPFVVPFRPMA